jgi:type VI secretion system protein ImpL
MSMRLLNDIYYLISPYLGYFLYTVLFFAIAIVGFVIAKKTAAKKGNEDEEESSQGEKKVVPSKVGATVPPSNIRRSFRRAMSKLKSNIIGDATKYKVSWFMVVGQRESGKSTLLSHTGLNLSFGLPESQTMGSRDGCNWWFFDEGVMLDIDGELFLRRDGKSHDSKGWKTLLESLQNSRSKRPIDGVILTIPATELYGSEKSEADRSIEAGSKSAQIFERLKQAQLELGIRFPIFILVTKCDVVPGFKSFCGELPHRVHHDIFGWSNPYTLETTYDSTWVDDAFQDLFKELRQTQIESLVDGIQVQTGDSFFKFPTEFISMKEPLKTYFNNLFKQTSYHESFVFRGMYFCGDGEGDEVGTLFRSSELTKPKEISREGSDEHNVGSGIYFLKDLFLKKVFKEYRIARPTEKSFVSRNKLAWTLRTAAFVFVLLWGVGSWVSFNQLNEDKKDLKPVLIKIKKDLETLSVGRSLDEESERDFFTNSAKSLLQGMTKISSNNFFSVFIPASWTTTLDKDIQKTMVLAYDKIILKSIFFGLQVRLKKIIEDSDALYIREKVKSEGKLFSWEKSPEFIQLNKLVVDLDEYWKNIQSYNGLKSSRNLNDLGDIITYLFGIKLRTGFYKNAMLYHNALSEVEYTELYADVDKFLVTIPKVRTVTTNLYSQVFASNPLLEDIQEFSDFIDQIQSLKGENHTDDEREESFRDLLLNIKRMQNLLLKPEFAWLANKNLDLGPNFDKMIENIGSSPFLGVKLKSDLEKIGQQEFLNLKAELNVQETVLTGPILAEEGDNQAIVLSPQVLDLKTAMEKFLNQKFMAKVVERRELIVDLEPNTQILWDTTLLESAINLDEKFQKFRENDLPKFPKPLQAQVLKLAMDRLAKNILKLIAEAQEIREVKSNQLTFVRQESDLSLEIKNFKDSSFYLGKLTDIFNSLNYVNASWALSELLSSHAYIVLSAVNRLLDDEGLYNFKENGFKWWDGSPGVSYAAFEVSDEKELVYLLTIQRERVKHLARQYAKPLLMFLENRTINRSPSEEEVLSRWRSILREIDYFEKKKTNGSVNLLEKFVLVDMKNAAPSDCLSTIQNKEPRGGNRDYFRKKLGNIIGKLLNQCRNLADDRVFQEYAKLENFFNRSLKGRFPFIKASNAPQADTKILQKFYWMFDKYVKKDLKLLEQSSQFGLSGDKALEFIYKLEEARSFFEPFLMQGKKKKAPPDFYFLQPEFRVYKDAEEGANQIIDWQLETPFGKVTKRSAKTRSIKWKLGNPIKFTFRWAKDAPFLPVTVKKPWGELEGRTTTYFFNNSWSLATVLTEFAADETDFKTSGIRAINTLKFESETREWSEEKAKKELYQPNKGKARFFVRLGVVNPGTKEFIQFPDLPPVAPQLVKELNS